MEFTNKEQLHEYLQNQEPIMKVGKWLDNVGIPHIHAFMNKGVPCYTKYSDIDEPYSLWSKEQCELHNQYLHNNKKVGQDKYLVDNCEHFVVLPNNTNSNMENINVIDVDCIDELWSLYEKGFPVLTTPYTLSRNKRLPHYYFNSSELIDRMLGKGVIDREIDILYNYVFEKKNNDIRGSGDMPMFEKADIEKYLNIGSDILKIQFDFKTRIENRKNKVNNVKAKVVKKTTKKGKVYNDIDLGSVILTPTWETISYKNLRRIFDVLPVDEYLDHKSYFCIVKTTIAMLNEMSNPLDYIHLVDNFYRKSSHYVEGWLEETQDNFCKFVNNKDYTGLRADWFYNKIKGIDRKLWLELAFNNNRKIDPKMFKNLNFDEAVEVFNMKVSYLSGDRSEYILYNPYQKKYEFKKKAQVQDDFANLYYEGKEKIVKQDGEHKLFKPAMPFFKNWNESVDRSQYDGGVVFEPNVLKVREECFNLFTGFEMDKIDDYEDEIKKLTKEEMEIELEPVLQHLRYLSGIDREEESFQYNLRYFAHIMKYPWIQPKVWLLWVSLQGCGKNIWLSFISSIIGEQYYLSSSHLGSLFGDFTESIRGKLLINLNEMSNAHKYECEMKELITEDTIDTKQKHKDNLKVKNCSSGVATTQITNCMSLELGDRRWMINKCNPITISEEFNEKQYFPKLIAILSQVRIKKMFLYYCRNYVAITEKYDFKANRVMTRLYKIVQNANMPYIVRFFSYWYKNASEGGETQKKLYTLFTQWKELNGESKLNLSLRSFITKIEEYIIESDNSSYLQLHPQCVIQCLGRSEGKKQKYYVLDMDRCKSYMESLDIDVIDFLPDSEDETDDEE